jgi:7,8-dihydropterin-6-yl-methyl-4-(beta-D-ribofuranosyl)aminobenzene 5'-phosphate synthase
MLKLTCVIENTANFASEFYAEHGLSILIEYGDNKILFDTGKSPEVLEKNMKLLNGFNDLNYVILSHGHNDHTGGLSHVYSNCSADIFMHEKAILPKYVFRNDNMQFIGTKGKLETNETPIKKDIKNKCTNIVFITKTIEIAPNIFIFTKILLKHSFEMIDQSFFVKNDGNLIKDNFEDEIALVVKTDNGLVIFSGCAHKGIVNTVSSAVEYFNENLYALIGGTHLVSAKDDQLKKTMKELQKFDPCYLVFGHCNGFDASCKFKNEFKNKFQTLESGKEIIIPLNSKVKF